MPGREVDVRQLQLNVDEALARLANRELAVELAELRSTMNNGTAQPAAAASQPSPSLSQRKLATGVVSVAESQRAHVALSRIVASICVRQQQRHAQERLRVFEQRALDAMRREHSERAVSEALMSSSSAAAGDCGGGPAFITVTALGEPLQRAYHSSILDLL